MIAGSVIVPMGTYWWEPHDFVIVTTFPAWHDTAPVQLFAGKQYDLNIAVKDISGQPTKATVEIEGTTYNLAFWRTVIIHKQNIYTFHLKKGLKVPMVKDGTIIKFKWKVVSGDGKSTLQKTTKGIVFGGPDGYFKLNGQKIDSSHLIFSTEEPTLNFEYHATKNPELIQAVYIEVTTIGYQDTQWFAKVKGTDNWKLTYELRDYGTFDLAGKVRTKDGVHFNQIGFKVDYQETPEIVVDGDEDGNGNGEGNGGDGAGNGEGGENGGGLPKYNQLTILGVVLMVVGVIVSFMQGPKRR